MLNISIFDQSQLYKQSQLKKLQDNSYLTDINNENFLYIKDKFFNWELNSKAQLLNIGSWLFTAVSWSIASYVWEPSLWYDLDISQYVEDFVALWFATIWIERVDWKLSTIYLPAKNYWNDNWIHKVLRMYVWDTSNIVQYFVLVQEYWIWYIENKLYRLLWTSLVWGVEVPLDTIPQTADMEQRVLTWLDVPAIIIVKEDEMEQYPTSIIEKIKNLVYAIDRQIVMQHTQFIQNVESFVLFKWIRLPTKLLTDYNSWKKINFSELWRVVMADEEWSIEFVKNSNDLIDKAMEDNNNHIRRISSMTTVPIDFLWLDSGDGAIGSWSRSLKYSSFFKTIWDIRAMFDKYILQIVEIIWTDQDYLWYTRPDVLEKSDKELVEELVIAREAKLISLYNAVKKYNDYTDEETDAEIEKILGEWVDQSKDNLDNKPTNDEV